jgi:hypothetical protein
VKNNRYNKVNFNKWNYGVKTSPFFTYIVSILKQIQVLLLYFFWKSCGSTWLGFEQIWGHNVNTSQLWEPNICWCLVFTIKIDYYRKAILRYPLLDEDTWFSLITLMSQYAMDYLDKSTPLSFPYSILYETIRTWS